MRFALFAAACLLAAPALAQTPAPGSAVTALRTATRANTAAPTAPGLLLSPFPAGQVESCAAEGSLSLGSLRSSLLINLFHAPRGCERRRDAWDLAAFGDVAAAKERMCQEKANRRAYAAAGHPCAADAR